VAVQDPHSLSLHFLLPLKREAGFDRAPPKTRNLNDEQDWKSGQGPRIVSLSE